MHIAINCRSFLKKKYTGIGRYAYHLVKSLSEIDTRNAYSLYAKKGIFNLTKRVPRFGPANFLSKIDRFNVGPEKFLGKIDIYHSPSPSTLDVNNGAKVVVTVHDLIFKTFPQGHTQKTLDETDKQFKNIGEKAAKIICCSKNTVRDLQKYFNIKKNKISMVYQGVDKNLFYLIGREEEKYAVKLLRNKGIHEPFILSVGTIEPRKNLENILHAFDKLRTRKQFQGKLVVIGMKGWMSESIYGLIRKLELKEHVIFLGYLSDPELRMFYNKAEAFVFPSFYEGFGFPIVEAFCCGTPVVTSNVSSCPEVAQDAAMIVDPYDPESISQGIAQIINDQEVKNMLREKGLRRAGDFNFRKTAKKTLDIYKEVYRM
ncbi:MAG: glycosyltransferase family 4 protein [Candidatus Omnitrophica bacterium]|nr:glycosyltransferase family 4 protein [Candidatus Omnitrophota bacterium]MCB9747391.1 glycosyltransferase family 4 protein [Candidatus Omnitrophota bacterium]